MLIGKLEVSPLGEALDPESGAEGGSSDGVSDGNAYGKLKVRSGDM